MDIELDITRELGTIDAKLSELASTTTTVNAHIRSGQFHTLFNKIFENIAKNYDVITANPIL